MLRDGRCRRLLAPQLCDRAGEHLRLPGPHRRLLVPLLRRQGAPASRLLRHRNTTDQWRCCAHRLLLQRPQGVLRSVLRHEGAVLSALELALAVAALLIGATGTFSPCGLSAIDTIGPTGHTGGRRITTAACATFLPGALVGGLVTFGSLAAARQTSSTARAAARPTSSLLRSPCWPRCSRRAGRRIVPQIRRQLPEHWRRVMPMPLAAALYGVLLGLGLHDLRPLLRGLGSGRGQPGGRAIRPSACSWESPSGSAGRSRSWCWRRWPATRYRHPRD